MPPSGLRTQCHTRSKHQGYMSIQCLDMNLTTSGNPRFLPSHTRSPREQRSFSLMLTVRKDSVCQAQGTRGASVHSQDPPHTAGQSLKATRSASRLSSGSPAPPGSEGCPTASFTRGKQDGREMGETTRHYDAGPQAWGAVTPGASRWIAEWTGSAASVVTLL